MRSAIKSDTRPLLRLLLRAKGLTGIPDARAQGPLDEADSDALFAATRCEESAFPWDRNAGAEQRAGQALGAAQGPSGHRLPAVQLQDRPAQRVDPRLPGVAEREPAAGAAGAAAGGAHADPLRRRPTCARRVEDAAERRRAHPRGAARRGPVHRPLGRDQRPQRLREERRSRPSSRASPPRSARLPRRSSRRRRSRRRGCPSCPGARSVTKTIAAVTATVRDVRLQFLGDEIAAGRATPVGAKVGGAALRPRDRDVARLQPAPGASSSPA